MNENGCMACSLRDICHIISWDTYSGMSKDELLDLYKEQKQNGKLVFVKGIGQYSGYWKLDNKGDIVLVGQELD